MVNHCTTEILIDHYSSLCRHSHIVTNDLVGLPISWCRHMQYIYFCLYSVLTYELCSCLVVGLGASIFWPDPHYLRIMCRCVCIVWKMLLGSSYLFTYRRVWHCVQGSTCRGGDTTFPKSCGSENFERLAVSPRGVKQGKSIVSTACKQQNASQC